MLSQKIASLITEIEKLSIEQQEILAEDIAADIAEAKFAAKLASNEPTPTLDALVTQAQEEIARGEYIDLDEWLQEGSK
jgi:hypothetical protein